MKLVFGDSMSFPDSGGGERGHTKTLSALWAKNTQKTYYINTIRDKIKFTSNSLTDCLVAWLLGCQYFQK